MKFCRISELLQTDSLRTTGAQDNCRMLWQDRGGTIFADEVLGDHQQALVKLGEHSGEAAVQQESNEQFRAGIAQYITEALGRDAALSAELTQLDAACDALEIKNTELRNSMTELAQQEPLLWKRVSEVISKCRGIYV